MAHPMRCLVVASLLVVGCAPGTSATPRPGGPDPGAYEAYVRSLCPAESVDACARAYLAADAAGPEALLCILPGGRWSIETPRPDGGGRRVGDTCGKEGSGKVRALINHEDQVGTQTVSPWEWFPAASAAPSVP